MIILQYSSVLYKFFSWIQFQKTIYLFVMPFQKSVIMLNNHDHNIGQNNRDYIFLYSNSPNEKQRVSDNKM